MREADSILPCVCRRWKRSTNYCAWKKDKLLNRRVKKMINRELVEGTVSSYRVLVRRSA